MKLSVVILNYNVRYFLEQTIKSVQQAIRSIDAEIIVIDNNSEDESCAMVKELFPRIHLIENSENVGFSKANNQAVAAAKGEYVCILNPDTAVPHNIFTDCLNVAAGLPHMGAMGVRLMDGTGNFLPESKRNLPTPKASILKLLGLAKRKNSYYANDITDWQQGEVDVLPGAFMLVKREVYTEVNGFDEDYFMYGEDIDFSYKLLAAGYRNYYYGNNGILHYKGESPQMDGAYLDRFYGAMKIFYKKHYNSNLLMNAMVQAGIAASKSLRKLKMRKADKPGPVVKEAIVITDNLNLLKALSEKIDIPVKSASKLLLNDGDLSNTMLVFDENYMSYNQIFMVMDRMKNRNNRFRIRPAGCNFIIGSDRSDEKGSVIVF